LNISYSTIWQRLARGLSDEQALSPDRVRSVTRAERKQRIQTSRAEPTSILEQIDARIGAGAEHRSQAIRMLIRAGLRELPTVAPDA
jgi:hypothetical protein